MSIESIAVDIAARLFINGAGQEADRLVLTSKEGRDLGGWCQGAVIDVIVERLKAVKESL